MSIAKPITKPQNRRVVQTTCAYCGVGCGVDIHLQNGQPTHLQGTANHPANFGSLCVKGSHLLETLSDDNRLKSPIVLNNMVSWDDATQHIADKFAEIIHTHGPDSVALYLSGQLLTEDYYIANKWFKGFVGTANVDTNSRLCMSSAVAGYKRAFGEDVVPCSYEDIDQTELLILIGSNTAWTHPVLYQRMEKAKLLNPDMRIVVVDPRITATCDLADLHLAIKPGSDAALYCGLLKFLSDNNGINKQFVNEHTDGIDEVLKQSINWTTQAVAEYCDIEQEVIEQFYKWFIDSNSALSFYSMGINQSSSGVDKCNAIINVHLASGKILSPGSGPFSITGQPNAMGGREVGGLANQLAAHMDVENTEHRATVQEFWQSPTIAQTQGLKAVDLFNAIKQGKVKAVWIMATNPLVSLPNRKVIEDALNKCELVVVSDCVAKNDTIDYADVILPSTGWGEKDGTVTNSERRISRQRGFLSPYGSSRHDWDIMCEVATKMGYSGFDFKHPSQIFKEWAKLTGFKNESSRQLDISSLGDITFEQYNKLIPQQWPLKQSSSNALFENNRFSTQNGRAKFIPIIPQPPKQCTTSEYPYVMNSGRLRDQWHTMTRTGISARLNSHIKKPFIEISDFDAQTLNIQTGDLIQAQSLIGYVTAEALVSKNVRKGECFMPIHWNKQFASSANVANLYASITDPISGQPESKHAAINITKAQFSHYGFVATQYDIEVSTEFFVKYKAQKSVQAWLAGNDGFDDLVTKLRKLADGKTEFFSHDIGQLKVLMVLENDKLFASMIVSRTPLSINSDWIDHLFGLNQIEQQQISSVLRLTPDKEFTHGDKVCSCFGVHEKPIIEAIKAGTNSVEALGQQLKCGTNCGSCKSELGLLVKQYTKTQQTIAVLEVDS